MVAPVPEPLDDTTMTMEQDIVDSIRELTQSIRDIDESWKEISGSGLTRQTLVILLQARCGLTKTGINKVLDALDDIGVNLKD